MTNELKDTYRSLTVKIKSWFYHVDYPEIHHQETTNDFLISSEGPFKNTRKEWIVQSVNTMIDKLTDLIIDEFGARGIQGAPGESNGSIDWDYEIVDSDFKFKEEECPDFVRKEIARLEKRKLRVRDEVAKMIDVEINAIKKEYNCE